MLLPVHSFEPDDMLRQHITKLVMSGLHISSTLTGDGMVSKGINGTARAKGTLETPRCVQTQPSLYGDLEYRRIKV